MSGVQFYLHRDVPTAHGHVIHIDTEWALTSISQLQFWRDVPPKQFGDSDVRGIISVDVSDWTTPGGNGRAGDVLFARRGRARDMAAAQTVDQCRAGAAAR